MFSPFACPLCHEEYSTDRSRHPLVLPCGCCACNVCISAEHKANPKQPLHCGSAHDFSVTVEEGGAAASYVPRNYLLELVCDLAANFEKADMFSAAQEIVDSTVGSPTTVSKIPEHRAARHDDERFLKRMLCVLGAECIANPQCYGHVSRELKSVVANLSTEEFIKLFNEASDKVESEGQKRVKEAIKSHQPNITAAWTIAVCDQEKHRVLICRTTGVVLREIGVAGRAGDHALELNSPSCVDSAPDKKIAICDRGNKRIAIFREDGIPLQHIPANSSAEKKMFESPSHVCFVHHNDVSKIVVCDEIAAGATALILVDLKTSGVLKKVELPPGLGVHEVCSIPHTECVAVSQGGTVKVYDMSIHSPSSPAAAGSRNNQKSAAAVEWNFPGAKGPILGISVAHFADAAGETSNLKPFLICDETDQSIKITTIAPEVDEETKLPVLAKEATDKARRISTVVPERDYAYGETHTGGPIHATFLGFADEVNELSPLEVAVCDRGHHRLSIFRVQDAKFVRSLQFAPTTEHRVRLEGSRFMVKNPVSVCMVLP